MPGSNVAKKVAIFGCPERQKVAIFDVWERQKGGLCVVGRASRTTCRIMGVGG